jgi:hypothetical protein
MLGPLRPTKGLLPILQLQPLDLLGVDFIRPFRPIADSGARYICIAVDYFSRYLWAKALPTATSANALEFLRHSVTETFGWPRALYTDNGSHFAGGPFPQKLREMNVQHTFAPITHPSSVGLAERYVQVVLQGLRARLQSHAQRIFVWDEHLPDVVKGINTRTIKIHGYTPCELLLGINARHYRLGGTFEGEVRGEVIVNAAELLRQGRTQEEAVYTARLAMIDEVRDQATTKRLGDQRKQVEKSEKRRANLEKDDLVLLRRLSQDNQRGHKLEPRWTGPYRLAKIARHGRSGWLQDLNSDQDIGRYHINDLKAFIPRSTFSDLTPGWKSVAKSNEELRQMLLKPKWHQERREEAARRQEAREEGEGNPSPGWFQEPGDRLQGYGDEADWSFWRNREIDLQRYMGFGPIYRQPN